MKKNLFTLLLILFIPFINLYSQTYEDFTYVNSEVGYKYIGSYDVNKLNEILTTEAESFSDFEVTFSSVANGVKLYRVIYNSEIPEMNNKPTVASGLIAIPDIENKKMPLVSYQHGTVFTKTDVPSFPDESMETRLMIAHFAGNGYIVIGADYFGKGLSSEQDSYQVNASTQQACLDMLKASDEILNSMNIEHGPLFLSGWSMGSWATLLFLQKLESLNIEVTSTSVACTPTDVYAMINRWIHAPEKGDAVWLPGILALQLSSYSIYYDLPGLMESGIKAEYQQATRDFYENKITFEEFYSKTPDNVDDYLKSEFKESSSSGENRYWQIIQNNNSYRWRSRTPLNLYFGESDEAVPVYIGTLPVDYQLLMGGGKTISVSAGKLADHRGTFKYSVEHSKKVYDEILKKNN